MVDSRGSLSLSGSGVASRRVSHPQGDGTDSLFGAEAGSGEESSEGGEALPRGHPMPASGAPAPATDNGEPATGDGQSIADNDVSDNDVSGNDVSGADTGVLAQAALKPARDKHGRLLPGYSANPSGRSNADRALIRHIHASFTPAEVVTMIRAAYETAAARGSWRGQLEVARFITEYTIGKPVQRSVTVSSRAGELLQQLASMQLGPDDTHTIEIEASEQ